MLRSVVVLLTGLLVVLFAVCAESAEPSVTRRGDELYVRFEHLDVLRQRHATLQATLLVQGDGGERRFALDLADPVVTETVVVDLAGYGACSGVSIEVHGADGQTIYARQVGPVPTTSIADLPATGGSWSAIEPGSGAAGDAPRIALPDPAQARPEKLGLPQRVVTARQITFPVMARSDLPIPASENYVLVSRQTAAPNDADRVSLYFSYRKPIYDTATAKLKHWRKFLVEVPLERDWLDRPAGDVITLPLDKFAVHATEEASPRGTNMLGHAQNGLAQGGQSADTDEQGRIYFSNLNDGAGLVRYNPRTGQLEQPPVPFVEAIRKLIPAETGWTRSWDTDLGELLCLRGRLYILFARNYRVHTPNGKFETCSGVISLPQDVWNDAAAFGADVRLHAGCWPGAAHPFYDEAPPPADYARKLTTPIATRHGMTFGSASTPGERWRLDLDAAGNTERLVRVRELKDSVSIDGAPVEPTAIVTYGGLGKQRLINVGAAGRQFVQSSYGEFVISRAALALTLPGATPEQLVDSQGSHRITFPGAPDGTLAVRFDIAGALQADPTRFGELASALSGISQGPNYCVTPIPGEPDSALGVCEYGYYYSKFDFSRRAAEGRVFKEYLPLESGGMKTNLPVRVGVGPYHSTWARHDGALWLYAMGYTGITRMKYAVRDEPLEAFTVESVHGRLRPRPVDGRPRGSVKDFLHLLPAPDGRLIDLSRGRSGRGGGPFSAGLELFDPRTLGDSQTAVHLSRCYGLYTPVHRLVLSAAGGPMRQELFVASGAIRPEFVADLPDPALTPANQDPKVFLYDCASGGHLRDRYGFSLPLPAGGADGSSSLAWSPVGQYLVLLQTSGHCYTYCPAERQFVDAVQLVDAAGKPVRPISFDRPSTHFWSPPSGELLFATAGQAGGIAANEGVSFVEVVVSSTGRIAGRNHLAISDAQAGDIEGVVRCFLPDLSRRDGSYDFVLGGDQENGQPTVRVIDDFIPARVSPAP
jgi:hypothetical protein